MAVEEGTLAASHHHIYSVESGEFCDAKAEGLVATFVLLCVLAVLTGISLRTLLMILATETCALLFR